MLHKKQRGQKDCGFATVAMIAEESYALVRALWHEFSDEDYVGRHRGITVQEMHGFLSFITSRTWRLIDYGVEPAKMDKLKKWAAPPGRCAALIWPQPGHVGHWIALNGGVVYDPKDHYPVLPTRSLRKDFYVARVVTEV